MNGYTSSNRALGNSLIAFVGGMVVWALFGNKIKARVSENQTFQTLREKVMLKAEQVGGMTESKYNQIVDEVSTGYAKAQGISQNELQDLIKDLRMHWLRIKDRWNQPNQSNKPDEPQKIANNTDFPEISTSKNFDDGFNY